MHIWRSFLFVYNASLCLWRTRRIGAHSGQVALVCHGNVLSRGYCVSFSTVCLRRCESWMFEFSRDTEIALKMGYFWCFWVSFCQGYMVNKRRYYRPEGNALHMLHGHYRTQHSVVDILHKSNFCVRKSLFPVQNAWILEEFDHLAGPLGFRSSVHRALNNTETVLLLFLMCIKTELECCMILTKCNTTLLEAQHCTFWTLIMAISFFVENPWPIIQLDHRAEHLGSR